MLTAIVPEACDYAEILAEVKAEPLVYNGVTYYADGQGGLHTDPEKAAKIAYDWTEYCRKAWSDLARRLA